MNIIYQDETPWLFELGEFLTDRGLTSGNISEVVMYVKNNLTDADESALVTKALTSSQITISNDGDALEVDINSSDYGSSKMEIGGTYYVSIGLTVTGYSGVYLEASLKDNTVTILQDGIRS